MKIMIEDLTAEFKQHWEKIGYDIPSVIQLKTYDPLNENKDVVGISPTGTGKTVAYTLPILEKTLPESGLQVLILVPSQELAVQVSSVVKEWAEKIDLSVQTLIGGANKKRQIKKLKEKPEIIVGTPGRILELTKDKKIKVHQIKTVIMDEADHLLQEDQFETIKELISKIPKKRQLGFFSATSNEVMEQLLKWFNADPLWIDVTEEDQSKGKLNHAYIDTPTRKRTDVLRRLAQVNQFRGLVFVNNVENLTLVFEKLQYHGISVAVLHSEKYKTERKKALQQFRDGKVQLLLTTDLASRGLDIQELPYVIQYDLPLTKESYIHRSGRTARMGREGTILTLLNERELREFKKIISSLNLSLTPIYLYDKNLVLERPKMNKEDKKTSVDHLKSKPLRVEHTKKLTRPKKKNRKTNKNKGARRKKKE